MRWLHFPVLVASGSCFQYVHVGLNHIVFEIRAGDLRGYTYHGQQECVAVWSYPLPGIICYCSYYNACVGYGHFFLLILCFLLTVQEGS